MSFVLFDDKSRQNLQPFTRLRPVGAIRIGILTIAEKWRHYLGQDYSYDTEAYLRPLFPEKAGSSLFIHGSVCPDADLCDAVLGLKDGQQLVADGFVIAHNRGQGNLSRFVSISYTDSFNRIVYPEDIFRLNAAELEKDFRLLTWGRTSAALSSTNAVLGDRFFAEPGASAECSTFNTLKGPIYLGRGSEVWEGCHIRGGFSLGENSQVKMGAKIYGATTIGPNCRVGGEINNSVIFGNSSKGHEGYLGNSVLGEWCNIGAGTDNSNMKNNYSAVKIWDYAKNDFRDTGLQFCGLFMGDHTKCGIGTMFNTGTVAGIGANIFGEGYQPKFIPDFSWGRDGLYDSEKFIRTIGNVYKRRDREISKEEREVLDALFTKAAFA